MTKPTDAMIEAVDWRKLAINLAMREADYRLNHDVHSDGHINAGRAWDRMRCSGDAIRKAALSATPDDGLAGELVSGLGKGWQSSANQLSGNIDVFLHGGRQPNTQDIPLMVVLLKAAKASIDSILALSATDGRKAGEA